MGENLAHLVTALPSLLSKRFCGSGATTFLFCHVPLRDYMIEGTCDLVSGRPSPYVTTLPSSMVESLVEGR